MAGIFNINNCPVICIYKLYIRNGNYRCFRLCFYTARRSPAFCFKKFFITCKYLILCCSCCYNIILFNIYHCIHFHKTAIIFKYHYISRNPCNIYKAWKCCIISFFLYFTLCCCHCRMFLCT